LHNFSIRKKLSAKYLIEQFSVGQNFIVEDNFRLFKSNQQFFPIRVYIDHSRNIFPQNL